MGRCDVLIPCNMFVELKVSFFFEGRGGGGGGQLVSVVPKVPRRFHGMWDLRHKDHLMRSETHPKNNGSPHFEPYRS